MDYNQSNFKELVELYQLGKIDLAKDKVENLIKKKKNDPVLLNIYA